MRLGQLSRKISVRPAEIVSFLSAKGIVVDDNTNSRISDEDAKMAFAYFAPHLKFEDTPEEPVESVVNEVELSDTTPKPLQEEIISASEPESENPSPEAIEVSVPPEASAPEVIKAAKVELKGLRVVGKIDLPQPKKKEQAPPTDETVPEQIDNRPPQRKGTHDKGRQRHQISGKNTASRKNPIALQREKEAREAEERKKTEMQKEKEKRTQYYMQRVKPSAPARRASVVDEPLVQLQDEAPDEPKTLWGRFRKWLTSH